MPVNFSVALQRAGPIAEMPALLSEFGIAPEDVARGSGIDLEGLSPDSLIPFSAVLHLLEQAALQTNCPHFGLTLGHRYSVSSHGVISRAAPQTRTLREALLTFVSLQPGYSSGATVYLRPIGPNFIFGYGIYDRISLGSIQVYDCVLAVGVNFVRALTKGRVSPVEVRYCHREPNDIGPYAHLMKTPLRFNETQSGIILSRSTIDCELPRTLPQEDREICASDVPLDIRFLRTSARLRHTLKPQLMAGDASMIGAARQLGLTPRTLRRHLADEAMTFEGIRDDVRSVLARELLALTDLPLGEISASLVFANQSAFVRAFRRWSGKTPSQFRAEVAESGNAMR